MRSPDTCVLTYRRDTITPVLRCKAIICANGQTIEVDAIWDTGASISCISVSVETQLSLIPIGYTQNYTAGGVTPAQIYYVDIRLTDDIVFEDVRVIDSEIGAQGLGLLIGMDIISLGDFAVSNYKGRTTFTFRLPSRQKIDFCAQAQVQAITGQHGKGKRRNK